MSRYAAIIRKTAMQMYVERGLSLKEIYAELGGSPSLRQIQRWYAEDEWEDAKARRQTTYGDVATLRSTLSRIIREAEEEVNPDSRNQLLMSAKRCMDTIESMETAVDKERAVLVGARHLVDYCTLHGDRELAEDIAAIVEPCAKWIKTTGGSL